MNLEEIGNIFTYHPPFGDQGVRYDQLRHSAKALALLIETNCPGSREKSLAYTKLQECVMMANAAIAIHEKPEGGIPRGGHLASMPEAEQTAAEISVGDPDHRVSDQEPLTDDPAGKFQEEEKEPA